MRQDAPRDTPPSATTSPNSPFTSTPPDTGSSYSSRNGLDGSPWLVAELQDGAGVDGPRTGFRAQRARALWPANRRRARRGGRTSLTRQRWRGRRPGREESSIGGTGGGRAKVC